MDVFYLQADILNYLFYCLLRFNRRAPRQTTPCRNTSWNSSQAPWYSPIFACFFKRKGISGRMKCNYYHCFPAEFFRIQRIPAMLERNYQKLTEKADGNPLSKYKLILLSNSNDIHAVVFFDASLQLLSANQT